MALISFQAGQLVRNPQSGLLEADQRQGVIQLDILDEGLYSFQFLGVGTDEAELDLVLSLGDATFHHIPKEDSQVVGLKLASSGSKYFFWLQDPRDRAAHLVPRLNAIIQGSESAESTAAEPTVPSAPPADRISAFAKSLAGIFGAKRVDPGSLLTTDNILSCCEDKEDFEALSSLFPEGYRANKQDLRDLASSPYFQQAVRTINGLMTSESAPTFMAQFGLLELAGDYPLGFSALLKALLKKYGH